MSKQKEAPQTQNKGKGLTITVDMDCPYCRGKRGHSKSQRSACKAKGPVRDK